MSLIDPNSCECLKSELELFQVPPTQVAIEKSYYVKYHPLTSLDKGGPIEFRINAGEDTYIDPSNIILCTKNRILIDRDQKIDTFRTVEVPVEEEAIKEEKDEGNEEEGDEGEGGGGGDIHERPEGAEPQPEEPQPVEPVGEDVEHQEGDGRRRRKRAADERPQRVKRAGKKGAKKQEREYVTRQEPNPKNAVFPINYFHATRFKSLEVHLNNQLISSSDNLYPYRAFLELLLSYNQNSKATQYEMGMYNRDTNQIDDNTEGMDYGRTYTKSRANTGAIDRWARTHSSVPFETMGRIHSDMFNQDKLIPGNSILKLKFNRANPNFCLQARQENDYDISIDKAFLLVRHVEVSPSIREAHLKQVQKEPFKFPIRRVEMTYFTKGAGRQDISENNLLNGPLPRRVVLGLVHSDAFHGNYKMSPLNFQNFGVEKIALKVGGNSLPFQEPLEMDYSQNCAMQGYFSLLQGTGRLFSDCDNGISYDDYLDGCCLYAFDLANDMSDTGHFELVKEGELGVEITLTKPVDHSITMVAYYEYDSILKIDENKETVIVE